jgi:hypothetical protein
VLGYGGGHSSQTFVTSSLTFVALAVPVLEMILRRIFCSCNGTPLAGTLVCSQCAPNVWQAMVRLSLVLCSRSPLH